MLRACNLLPSAFEDWASRSWQMLFEGRSLGEWDGIFAMTGLLGMLERKDYRTLDKVVSFCSSVHRPEYGERKCRIYDECAYVLR